MSGKGSDTVVEHDAGYGKDSGTFHCAAGWVRYTSGSRIMTGNPAWLYAYAPAFTSGALAADKPYYVYMRVSGESGTFIVSETPKDLTAGSIRYLLLGILDSEQFGNRSWCPLYGYTEITPGRIRVNKIISSDGKTYFDLQNNEIGGRINFKDGLVSGEVGVAGSSGAVNAGMSGADDEDVRFWAGATSDDKAAAPFRVHDNGNVVMNDAIIGGDSTFGGLLKQNVITMDGMYISGDTNGKQIFYSPIGGDGPVLDWSRIFGFRTTLIVRSQPAFDFESDLFGLMNGIIVPSYFKGNLYDYRGNLIIIINESDTAFGLGQCGIREIDNDKKFESIICLPYQEVIMEFIIHNSSKYGTMMGWLVKYQGPILNAEKWHS